MELCGLICSILMMHGVWKEYLEFLKLFIVFYIFQSLLVQAYEYN